MKDCEQSAKHDEGKPRLSLVPPSLIEAVGIIRTYGTEKYNNDPDGWKRVSKERYKDALMRHLVEYLKDEKAVDVESGYLDLWHIACNVAFLIEMEGEEYEQYIIPSTCLYCGKEFIGQLGEKYCSTSCNRKYYYCVRDNRPLPRL